MNTHRTVDIAVALAQVLDRLGIVGTDADAQKVADATRAGRIQGRIQGALVGSEVETVEVAMGIYKHGRMTTLKSNEGTAQLNAGPATSPRTPAAPRATALD
ncbi:hypothetical protein D9M73_257340 [compost metagenome]